MTYIHLLIRLAAATRQFFLPTYHPERHYMRGPGPACARRNQSGTR